jgi:serine/threonine protein kinase
LSFQKLATRNFSDAISHGIIDPKGGGLEDSTHPSLELAAMPRSSDDRDPVERLAEEFLERHRRGEHPALTEYVDRYPEWAGDIRELFPALVMMERLKPAAADVTGSFIDGERTDPGRLPERLGDFRILREVGRGGMGIVFEAEQESLGRHVALKVLPAHALINPRHLQRFLREAQAAAKPHHTNIVPAFGAGEGEGLHYYVMQFIAGSGLHEVIDELKRLKAAVVSPADASSRPEPTRSVRDLAQSLLTGQFVLNPAHETTEAGLSNGQTDSGQHGKIVRSVHPGSSILSRSGRNFAKAVARVGLQVAEALDYAHGQGVLHRDIKPSNLLLDVQGTVWVTDFGLAKAMADSDNLTHEGDLLGTLRYMAPERFRGRSDARSDLYALRLTLYELLTLRPAFDQEDRDQLIHQVTIEVPPRLRALNPEIPRDLETIVQKAIEQDPARRYQDAEDLAEDLRRFLGDRPIKARAVGVLERAWKWALRKPAIAALLAALVVALVTGFAGITWQWREAVAARDDAKASEKKSRINFAHALETVNTFCTQVSEEQLLDQPGMQPLRRRLLELARQYYQEFQREQGENPDPSLIKELALSFLRSGIITNEFGEVAAGHKLLLRARDIFNRLYRDDPQDVDVLWQFIRCHIEFEDANRQSDFGISYTTTTNSFDIEMTHLMESLVAAEPDDRQNLNLLGRCYNANGNRELDRARYSAARDILRKAIATLERACEAAPDDVEAARSLAVAQVNLGLVFQHTGRHSERARMIEKARTIFQSLEARFPASRRHRFDHGWCLAQLGAARIDLGQHREAMTALGEADDHLGRLFGEDRGVAHVRQWLVVARRELSRVALAQGQTAAAARLREAIAMYEQAPRPSLGGPELLELGWSYLRLAQAELHLGQYGAVRLHLAKLVEAVEAFKGQLVIGVLPTHKSREVHQVEGLGEACLAASRATTPTERITAQQRALQVWKTLADKQPDNPALAFEFESSRVQLAELQEREGQAKEAGALLNGAFPVLKALAQSERENLRRAQGLARAWETLGRVHARIGRMNEARDAADEAIAITGELTRLDTAYLYDLACMFSLRCKLGPSEADAKAAIAALHRARNAGFGNDYLLRTDPRLDGLRSRPDFQVLTGKPS